MGLFGRESDRVSTEPLETVVGPSASLTGHLRSDGGVRIDGAFEGTIEVAGNVVIGEGARVAADISARNITVGGAVKGQIDGVGRLEILSTGKVFGDIMVAAVMIDEGGVFQGTSRMRGMEQRALAAPEFDFEAADSETVVEYEVPDDAVDAEARPARSEDAKGRPEEAADEPADETTDDSPEEDHGDDVAVPDLDLDDIEPIIPDVVAEEAPEADEKPKKRSRKSRKKG